MAGHLRLRLAIAGFGTVGSAVARILIEQSSGAIEQSSSAIEQISSAIEQSRGASPFELAYILNRRIAEKRVDWVPDADFRGHFRARRDFA